MQLERLSRSWLPHSNPIPAAGWYVHLYQYMYTIMIITRSVPLSTIKTISTLAGRVFKISTIYVMYVNQTPGFR